MKTVACVGPVGPRADIVEVMNISRGGMCFRSSRTYREDSWIQVDEAEKAETSKENYAGYIREAFGNGYRLSDVNWKKLRSGTFYNPWHRRKEIDGSKVMRFHAKDDPNVPYERTRQFAELTDAALKSINKDGHISTDYVVRKFWAQIKRFFDSAGIPVR